MAKKVPVSTLVRELALALNRGDGYIMASYGQNPRTGYLDLSITKCKAAWEPDGLYYTQYSGSQRTQALKWRKRCTRVWDCNGMAEGVYEIYTGVSINARARDNYAGWCGVKGTGMIPAKYRVPGAAVFWGDTASTIHHVAYLWKPVEANKPSGDWYLIEARGVMYGVIKSKLLSRRPNYWGLMDKYFDYASSVGESEPTHATLGSRVLKNGCVGEDVRELQEILMKLGYNLGKWGVDGDFGDCTEMAVRQFQTQQGLKVDGKVDDKTVAALKAAIAAYNATVPNPSYVSIVGGSCYVREQPEVGAEILGVAKEGTKYIYDGKTSANGWLMISYKERSGWVSGKYGKLV